MANMTIVEQVQNVDVSNVAGFLDSSFLNNVIYDYLLFIGIFILSWILMKLFKFYLVHLLKKFAKKTKTAVDDILIEVLNAVRWPFYMFISLIIAVKSITISGLFQSIISKLLIIVSTYYFILGLNKIIDYYSKSAIKQRRASEDFKNTSMIRILSTMGKGLLWVVGFLFILTNFDVNITPIIASLGIGGIAVAFALQNVLEDLFSSFTIYFDEPFKDGDFVVVGTDKGTIKKVGLKSTRITTLQGEELIVSNRELTNVRISNFKKMEKRRIVFGFGVVYATTSAKLKKIDKIVKKIIEGIVDVEFNRCHFKQFGAYSLDFEVVYFVNMGDYAIYMDKQEDINFKIKAAFEKEKIEMAFPTQTVFIEK